MKFSYTSSINTNFNYHCNFLWYDLEHDEARCSYYNGNIIKTCENCRYRTVGQERMFHSLRSMMDRINNDI